MNELHHELTEEEVVTATKESRVSEKELLSEIEPLLKDYFIGKFKNDGNGIEYGLLNGQNFIIRVQEILP